ncbi:MAG: SMP-30/gluconolactonase/LRE family protein [Rhizobiaceae bacterium]|nr:SMP-30/gluconolactonase/LRE family protein [Rhizobiaceae bacterium]
MSLGLSECRPISDHRYLAAESPIWDDRRGCAFFVDIKGHLLCAHDPATGATRHWPVAEDIGFVALTTGEGLVLGLKSGLYLFDLQSSVMTRLPVLDVAEDERLNDGKVAPDGSLYFGTMALDAAAGRGRLFRLAADMSLELIDRDYGVPNGPAFTPDGALLHCDTSVNRIHQLCRDEDGWRRVKTLEIPEKYGHPDGIELDPAGNLWAGLWGGSGLLTIAASSGLMQHLPLPASYVTSLCPIGTDATTLLVTSARTPLLRGEPQRQPHDGAVFIARLESSWPARSCRFDVDW